MAKITCGLGLGCSVSASCLTGTGKGGHTGMVPPDQVKSMFFPVWVDNSVSMPIQWWFLYQGCKYCTIYWKINHSFSFLFKLPICFAMEWVKAKLDTVVSAGLRSCCWVKENLSPWLCDAALALALTVLSPFSLLRKPSQKKEWLRSSSFPLGVKPSFFPHQRHHNSLLSREF